MHATTVALEDKGVLIRGASGAGKSALALDLMSRGAVLVSDDKTRLEDVQGKIIATAPEQIRGLIEARGVGLLKADSVASAQIALIIDLDQLETDRLPPFRQTTLIGHQLPLLRRVEHAHFPAAIVQYLRYGRYA